MPLSKRFKETVVARVKSDPKFKRALLIEGIECMLTGDVDTGKAILRDYINATIGFDALAKVTDKSPKSLMRMLSPQGNPRSDNLFAIVAYLQKKEGVRLHVDAKKR